MSWSKLFNPPNLFLLALTVTVILLTFTRVNSFNIRAREQLEVTSMRVVENKGSHFGKNQYYVWTNQGFWLTSSKDRLEVGLSYIFSGTFNPFHTTVFESSGYDSYLRSLGVLGEIDVKKIIAKSNFCDISCHLVKSIQSFRLSLEKVYFRYYCVQSVKIWNWFFPVVSCQNITGLSVGLVVGGMNFFDDEAKANFRKLGLTHLVAVSGFQVVMVLSLLEKAAVTSMVSRKWRILVYFFGVVGLVVLVGPQPPVLRSSVSVLLSQLVLIFLGRKVETFRALLYSAFIMLLFNPFYIVSVSFQLSFLSSLGLVLTANQEELTLDDFLSENLAKFFYLLKEVLSSTFWSILFTLPIIVNINGSISLISLLSNLVFVPIVPFITLLNILGLIPFFGELFLLINGFLQGFLLWLSTQFSTSLFQLGFSSLGFLEAVIYYIGLILLIVIIQKFKSKHIVSDVD